MRFEPNPAEGGERPSSRSLDDLEAAYEKRRLVRRGVPIKTDTYLIADKGDLGAQPRAILGELFRETRPAAPMSFRSRETS